MIRLLAGVSAIYSWQYPFLGVVIFTLGLFVVFQAHRSRLLAGVARRPAPTARKVRAAVAALVIAGGAAPLLGDAAAKKDFFEAGHQADVWFPVVILVGFLASGLMAGLIVEGRKR